MSQEFNRRVLVIDDEEVIRDSIREILDPPREVSSGLDEAAAALFGDDAPVEKRRNELMRFEVDTAVNGRSGYEQAREAARAGRPYALIFLDMRMPGWNGLETAARIREIDEKVELVVITAYSDFSIDEIRERAGAGVGYFCKPFEIDEVRQMAIKGVYDWNRLRDLERLIQTVSTLRIGPNDLDVLLQNILAHLNSLLGAQASALVHRAREESRTEPLFLHGIDSFENFSRLAQTDIDRLLARSSDQVLVDNKLVVVPIESYAIVSVVDVSSSILQSTIYLVKLFVEHSRKAIENARLHLVISRQEKLATMGQAISEVVHDLRTPMNVIRGALQMSRAYPEDAELREEMVGMALGAAETYHGLLDDLLSFVKGIRVETEPVDVAAMLEGIRRKFEILGRERPIAIRTDSPEGLMIRADRRKLERALTNLMNNAIEAMVHHGVANPRLFLSAVSEGSSVEISVEDNGPGVPDVLKSTIFEPFTSHGKMQGTGLGCAISREVARAHGGDIRLASTPAGACFVLSIPGP